MNPRKRGRSLDKQIPLTALREDAGVSPHAEQPEEPLVDPPEKKKEIDTTIRSIDAVLEMRLPYLEKNPLHTNSTATRAPQYYDRHLAEALRLKKVAFMSKAFFDLLIKICDHYYKQLSESQEGKSILSSFPVLLLPARNKIINEKSLVAYFEELHRHFSLIAATLLFRTHWDAVFGFSAETELTASDDAAADAYFFALEDAGRLLPSEHKPGFDLVHKYDLQIPINWEYKNLGFGPEIFSALRSHGGDFHWTTCEERLDRDDATSRCPNQTHRTEGRLTVTGRPTGPDAFAISDIIKASTFSSIPDDGEERPSKRLRKDKKSGVERKVQYILQQAWTSAVVQDASFIVISTGNEECIAIRHRETQRLFISPPIRPSDKTGPAYVKVCVGLFILAYQDTVDRALQLNSDTLSLYAEALLRLRIDNRPALLNASASGLFERHPVSSEVLPLDSYFFYLLNKSTHIDLRLHGKVLATVQYNPNTWTLRRDGSENPMASPVESVMNNRVVFLDLDRLFDKTSRIFKVYLGVTNGTNNKTDYFSKPLVLKMARDAREMADLKMEHEWYEHFKNAGVTSIVECYGLFTCQMNKYEKRSFLLLEDGGVPVSNRPGTIRLVHTNKYRDLYEGTVTDVHKHNFTHSNIKEEHILMDVTREKATLISLKSCLKPDETVAAFLKAKDIIDLGLRIGILSQDGSPTPGGSDPRSDIKEGGRSEVPSTAFIIVD
ncbi:hypothetical protein CPB84DRAFT_137370 [Gymnopilus junonius]|uniref:Uncharacterized protein n=1 Tax=Gymnopilus junonius TaxID=109634 RepID=A0A9P5NID7_GYMJU|nr:hypothetical protein CPB84DRAFT_137370 [Gymnopilus junonius]